MSSMLASSGTGFVYVFDKYLSFIKRKNSFRIIKLFEWRGRIIQRSGKRRWRRVLQ